jgi:hypothetical protein
MPPREPVLRRPRIPVFPLARLWWTLVCCARRRPAAAVAILTAVVMIAGVGVITTAHVPAGCQYRLVVVPGREHWVCAEAGGIGR